MAEFVLNVQDIDEIGKDYDFPIKASWLASSMTDTEVRPGSEEDGALRFRAHKQGRDVVINGTLRAALVAQCARCLADARIDVDTRYATLLVARGAELRPEPDELELTPEELANEFYSGDTIVLDDSVREHLLLEVPMQLLCTEDCNGITVPVEVAGPADLATPVNTSNGKAVDPRLAPLMKLVGSVGPNNVGSSSADPVEES